MEEKEKIVNEIKAEIKEELRKKFSKILEKRVPLAVYNCRNYNTDSYAPEFKKKFRLWKHYTDAVYLNNYRVLGPKDYSHDVVYSTELSGKTNGIEVSDIFEALDIDIEKDILNF